MHIVNSTAKIYIFRTEFFIRQLFLHKLSEKKLNSLINFKSFFISMCPNKHIKVFFFKKISTSPFTKKIRPSKAMQGCWKLSTLEKIMNFSEINLMTMLWNSLFIWSVLFSLLEKYPSTIFSIILIIFSYFLIQAHYKHIKASAEFLSPERLWSNAMFLLATWL